MELKENFSKTCNAILGDMFKRVRIHYELTQKEISLLINKSEITIRRYESGSLKINFNVWSSLKNALNLSDEFIDNTIESSIINFRDFIKKELELRKCTSGSASNGFLLSYITDSENYKLQLKELETFIIKELTSLKHYLINDTNIMLSPKNQLITKKILDNYIYSFLYTIIINEDKKESVKDIKEIQLQITKYIDFLLKEYNIK